MPWFVNVKFEYESYSPTVDIPRKLFQLLVLVIINYTSKNLTRNAASNVKIKISSDSDS